MGKMLLLFLIAVGLAIIGYTINLLLNDSVDTTIAIAVIVANSIVVIWDASILTKRYRRVRPGRIIATFVAFALIVSVVCAFAGVAPFSTAMDSIVGFFTGSEEGSPGGAPLATPSPMPISQTIATAQDMWVSNWVWGYDYALCVELKPSSFASAYKDYTVELYEWRVLRDTTNVEWNQAELNVLKAKTVYFPVTRSEFNAYFLEDISHIFSIQVR